MGMYYEINIRYHLSHLKHCCFLIKLSILADEIELRTYLCIDEAVIAQRHSVWIKMQFVGFMSGMGKWSIVTL